jgi:hypothetical protein
LLSGNLEAALAWLDPAIVIHEPIGLPYGGEYRGHEGFRLMTARMHEFWEAIAGAPELEMYVDGEMLIVVGTLLGRVRVTGKDLAMPVMERHQVREGRIIESWPFYFCTHTVRASAELRAP